MKSEIGGDEALLRLYVTLRFSYFSVNVGRMHVAREQLEGRYRVFMNY